MEQDKGVLEEKKKKTGGYEEPSLRVISLLSDDILTATYSPGAEAGDDWFWG